MFSIRSAVPTDAAAIAHVLETVISEGIYTAIEQAWPVADQQRYLERLSPREAFHVAEIGGRVVGYQSLDLYSPILTSMAHVAQMGTFLLPEARGRGVGRALFEASTAFARAKGYSKIVIQVRASNAGALGYYAAMGFRQCGRLSRQIRLARIEEDEIVMERFL